MSGADKEIEHLINSVKAIGNLKGTAFSNSQDINGPLKQRIDLPLKDRMGKNTDEAMAQHRLEKAKVGEIMNEPEGLDNDKTADEIVDRYIHELVTKVFK